MSPILFGVAMFMLHTSHFSSLILLWLPLVGFLLRITLSEKGWVFKINYWKGDIEEL